MLALPDKTARLQLLIVEHLADRVDGSTRNARCAQLRQPLIRLTLQKRLLQGRYQFVAVAHSQRVRRKAWICCQLFPVQQLAKRLIEPVIAARNNDVAIRGAESLVRHNIWMAVAQALCLFPRNKVVC